MGCADYYAAFHHEAASNFLGQETVWLKYSAIVRGGNVDCGALGGCLQTHDHLCASDLPDKCGGCAILSRIAFRFWIKRRSGLFGKTKLVNQFNLIRLAWSSCEKFPIYENRNICVLPAIPPRPEGRIAIVTNVKRDAMDALRRLTSDVVRGRRRRVVLAPLGWC